MATTTTTAADAAVVAPAPTRRIAALGVPLLIGAVSASASGVIDTAMMGRYGADELAAVSAASAVFDVFSSVVLASAVGYQILSARFAGRRDGTGLRAAFRSSAWFSGGIAAALLVPCLFAGGWLTGLVSDGGRGTNDIGADYLVARAPTLLLVLGFTLLASTFNAFERPKAPTAAAIAINVTNLVLDALLIYGPGPAPELGAVGNGLSTTLSWVGGLAVLAVVAARVHLRADLQEPGPGTTPEFETSVPKLAWPAIVSAALDYASVAAFFAIIGTVGDAALGGGRIAFELILLLFAVASAFAAAGRILVGRSLGAGDVDAAAVFWRTGQRMLLAPAVLVGVALVLLARPTAQIFTAFDPVVDAAADAMPLVGLSLPLLAWTLGNVSVLRALGHTKLDMYSNLAAALAIQLPMGWFLAHVADLGIRGAYLGVVGYWLARAVFTEVMARRSMDRERAEREREEART